MHIADILVPPDVLVYHSQGLERVVDIWEGDPAVLEEPSGNCTTTRQKPDRQPSVASRPHSRSVEVLIREGEARYTRICLKKPNERRKELLVWMEYDEPRIKEVMWPRRPGRDLDGRMRESGGERHGGVGTVFGGP